MVSRVGAELSRHLGPISAPDGLWERIENAAKPQPMRTLRWPMWAFAAAVAATIALFCFSLRSDTSSYMAQLALRELAAGSGNLDFASADPAQIRAWVKANAGLDLPLADARGSVFEPSRDRQGAHEPVHFLGVSLMREGGLAACVSYRVGGQIGKLLVARGSTAPQHPALQQTSSEGSVTASWMMGGQTYALAVRAPQDLRASCVLCHIEGATPRTGPKA